MDRQTVINTVYEQFSNAGDDHENAAARLELLGIDKAKIEDAQAAYDEKHPDEDNVEACPGCGCHPGDGRTPGCTDPDGCGYFN